MLHFNSLSHISDSKIRTIYILYQKNKRLVMLPKMADQMSRIKYKQPVLQSKPSGLCFVLMMSLCVLAVNICSVQTATCSSSVPPLTTTTTEQCTLGSFCVISNRHLYLVQS